MELNWLLGKFLHYLGIWVFLSTFRLLQQGGGFPGQLLHPLASLSALSKDCTYVRRREHVPIIKYSPLIQFRGEMQFSFLILHSFQKYN